jgi:hypothetical protein
VDEDDEAEVGEIKREDLTSNAATMNSTEMMGEEVKF